MMILTMFHRMETADVEQRDGHPYSRKYEDIFFAGDGPNETLRTFMEPADVRGRMARSRLFTIFELGFGTGLNFLVAATVFSKCAPANSRLRYFSCEKHPLSVQDAKQCTASWSSTMPLHEVLLDSWPPPIPGWHRRHLLNGHVELSVFHGDVKDSVSDFVRRDRCGVDAWFLDGFAPQRNPEMWDPEIFRMMFQRTNKDGTVTSFSSAGSVRRSLEQAGFNVTRINAEPFKRHTTLALGPSVQRFAKPGRPDVTVVGAGIAGTSMAGALARKRINVHLFDIRAAPAQMTSSIPVAIQHGRMSTADTPFSEFKAHSYTYSVALSKQLRGIQYTGAVHIPNRNMSLNRLGSVAGIVGLDWCRHVTRLECAERFGIQAEEGAFHFPKSNVVNGPECCLSLIDTEWVQMYPDQTLESHDPQTPTVWASGPDLPDFATLPALEVSSLEGQIDIFSSLNPRPQPDVAVVNDGYVVRLDDYLVSGSTYEYQPWERGEASATNRARIEPIFRGLSLQWKSKFRGTRLVTSDRLPVAGRVTDNLWLNVGYGSSGTTTAPYIAEILASQILGEISPASGVSESVFDPHRFESRQVRRPNPFSKRRAQA